MQFRNTAGALALLLVAACASDSAGPPVKNVGGGGDGARLAGRILGLTPAPDSTLVSIAGAQVTLVLVGPLPVDSLPPPPDSSPPVPPGDTMLWARLSLVHIQLDTIVTPPDSLPPPPPPVVGCGRSGDTVTSVTSDALGAYEVAGLEQGVYDVLVTPPEGLGFGQGYYCGLQLRTGSPTETNIYVPATP